MSAMQFVFAVLCAVGFIALIFEADRRKARTSKRGWKSKDTLCRVEYENGKMSALYFYKPNATHTKGKVWKFDACGEYYSKTGFDGPYKQVWRCRDNA